jgi:hypothetical protein
VCEIGVGEVWWNDHVGVSHATLSIDESRFETEVAAFLLHRLVLLFFVNNIAINLNQATPIAITMSLNLNLNLPDPNHQALVTRSWY